MASNQSFSMEHHFSKDSYTQLTPRTTKSQVIGWDVGEIDTKEIVIKAENWGGLLYIIVEVLGISKNDIAYVSLIPTGTREEMIQQRKEFSKITSVATGNNSVVFLARSFVPNVPTVDLKVRIEWLNSKIEEE